MQISMDIDSTVSTTAVSPLELARMKLLWIMQPLMSTPYKSLVAQQLA